MSVVSVNELQDSIVAVGVIRRWGQAFQFNFLLKKGGFACNQDSTFTVVSTKVRNIYCVPT